MEGPIWFWAEEENQIYVFPWIPNVTEGRENFQTFTLVLWFTFTLEMLILRVSWGQKKKEEGKKRREEERETRGSVAWWIVDSGRGLSQALATQGSDGNSGGNCRNLSALRRIGPVGMVRRNHRSVRENRKCNWRSGFESSQERRKSCGMRA